MGLGGFMKTWQRQLKDFGHTEADKFTSLTFDNRGMGESGKPLLRYTTSEMAKDLVELLDHVGWTENRSVHVVGISMGGMIAQELVCLTLNHERFATQLTLSSPGHAHPRTHMQPQPHLHRASNHSHETFLGEHSKQNQSHGS